MPRRNDLCPCGGGAKYKRCCLLSLEAVTRELRERDELLGQVIDWISDEHEQTVQEAGGETTLIRLLRGPAGQSASRVWALNDYPPTDGGLPLMGRFAARPGLAPATRELACGLSEAQVKVYRVSLVLDRLWVVIEPLDGGVPTRIAARDGLSDLTAGEILVARIVTTTTMPTTWGACFRFGAESERRWKAKLAALPPDPSSTALAILGFHPDNVAEPLPDGIGLRVATWQIDNDDEVLDAIEDDDAWECLGEAIPTGWAFSWLDDSASSDCDLGGWHEDDGAIETARLIVLERELRLVSADGQTLVAVARHVDAELCGLVASRPDMRAA